MDETKHAGWDGVLSGLRNRTKDKHSISECCQAVDFVLPHKDLLLDRNAMISGSYAATYLEHPDLFKWCGMAAFASHHVRKLIMIFDATHRGQPLAKKMSRLISTSELETIRNINNTIHNDIFWAHIVYDGNENGLDKLRTLVHDTPHQPIFDGFELIERGRQLQSSNKHEAGELIWKGNIALLWHEQQQIVQPFLSTMSGLFARVFSLGSSLNYEPSGLIDCMRYCSSFYLFMVFQESQLLIKSSSPPQLHKLDHRWAWITRVLIPNYRSLESDSAASKLAKIASTGFMDTHSVLDECQHPPLDGSDLCDTD